MKYKITYPYPIFYLEQKVLEKRIGKLENRLASLSGMYTTLYNRSYARHIRRSEAEKAAFRAAKRWVNLFDGKKELAIKVGKLAGALDNGRHLMTLNHQQHGKLYFLLRRMRKYGKR